VRFGARADSMYNKARAKAVEQRGGKRRYRPVESERGGESPAICDWECIANLQGELAIGNVMFIVSLELTGFAGCCGPHHAFPTTLSL